MDNMTNTPNTNPQPPTREQIAEALNTASHEAEEAEASWSELMFIMADAMLALLQKGGDDTHAVSDDYWDEADRD